MDTPGGWRHCPTLLLLLLLLPNRSKNPAPVATPPPPGKHVDNHTRLQPDPITAPHSSPPHSIDSHKAHRVLSWHLAHAQGASWSCSDPPQAPCCSSTAAPPPAHSRGWFVPGCLTQRWCAPGPRCLRGCCGTVALRARPQLVPRWVQGGSPAAGRHSDPGGQGTGT